MDRGYNPQIMGLYCIMGRIMGYLELLFSSNFFQFPSSFELTGMHCISKQLNYKYTTLLVEEIVYHICLGLIKSKTTTTEEEDQSGSNQLLSVSDYQPLASGDSTKDITSLLTFSLKSIPFNSHIVIIQCNPGHQRKLNTTDPDHGSHQGSVKIFSKANSLRTVQATQIQRQKLLD